LKGFYDGVESAFLMQSVFFEENVFLMEISLNDYLFHFYFYTYLYLGIVCSFVFKAYNLDRKFVF
jgi:hypothetical protein